VQIIFALSWAVTLYVCAARMVNTGAYRTSYAVVWSTALAQGVITALARSISFNDLRAATTKANAPPSAIERVRVALVCGFVFVMLCVVLPLGVASVVYVSV